MVMAEGVAAAKPWLISHQWSDVIFEYPAC